MLFNSIASLAIVAASAVTAEHGHVHKRGVVYVTETALTTVTMRVNAGAPPSIATAPAAIASAEVAINKAANAEAVATKAAPAAAVKPSTAAAPAAAVKPSTAAAPVAPAVKPSTAAAPVSSVAPTAATTLSSSSSLPTSSIPHGSAGAFGVTYSPYNADGTCKDLASVTSDLAKISDFGVIRLYGVDCNQMANVLQAKKSTQKVFAGIYFMDSITSGIQEMAAAVKAHGSWDDITTVSIGNELVNNGAATPAQIAAYVKEGRAALTAAGYTGPVVSVDTFIAVINNPELCAYSDYMAVNAHAFFDGGIAAADAGDWVLLQIQRVWSACNGSKDVNIVESGWPSQGQTNNKAVPSKANQAAAIASIKEKAGLSCILFNAYNDLWKADGAFAAEKYWGIL